MTFSQHAHDQVQAVIKAIPTDVAADVYVVELFLNVEEIDGRFPFIRVSWNTNEHLARTKARYGEAFGQREGDDQYFLAFAVAEIGERAKDPEGAKLRRRWIEEDLKAWYSDEEQKRDPDDAIERDAKIWDHVRELAVEIASQLHSSGLIERTFGKPVPVFIDSFESYDPIAEMNHKANPPELHPTLGRLERRE
jgi:hypothetical protein